MSDRNQTVCFDKASCHSPRTLEVDLSLTMTAAEYKSKIKPKIFLQPKLTVAGDGGDGKSYLLQGSQTRRGGLALATYEKLGTPNGHSRVFTTPGPPACPVAGDNGWHSL